MFLEQRPTSVTVIGWAWILIGTLLGVSAVFTVLSLVLWHDLGGGVDVELPLMFRLMPAIALIQGVIGIGGVVGGLGFLRLQARSRTLLEVLTWLTLVGVIAFMVVWLFNWFSVTSGEAPDGFTMMGGVMGFLVTLIYGAPLVAMLLALRGPKVAAAMR